MVNRLIATGLLALSLLSLVSCGAGSTAGLTSRDETRSGAGVRVGGFEVIRYNGSGFPDPALNGTLMVAVTNEGGQQALAISVTDSSFTTTVALDVKYDSGLLHPADVKFHGLLGNSSQVLSASFLSQQPGLAAIGETGIGTYVPGPLQGSFATLNFAAGGMRGVSAAGDVHQSAAGVGDIIGDHPQNPNTDLPNLTVDDTVADQVTLSWTAAWHLADGDQNGLVTISDITPLGSNLNVGVAADWGAIVADYDGNGIVTIGDLTPMGKHLNEGTENYLVEVMDDDGSEAGLAEVGTFDWSQTAGDDWTAPVGPPLTDSLTSVFKNWNVLLDGSSTPSFTDLSDADVDTNGFVNFRVTPQRAGQQGVPSVITAGVVPPDLTRYITVTGVSIQVVGATGGIGASTDVFDNANDIGTVQANTDVTILVNGINGTYSDIDNAGTFTEGTLPTGMTQADYDDALAAIRPTVTWLVANGGAANFHYRSDWLTFAVAPPAAGDLGPGRIFPDDDPESTGPTSEGQLTLSLPNGSDFDSDPLRSITASLFTQPFLFDVVTDPAAPLLGAAIDLATGQPATELTLLTGTRVEIPLTLLAAPADPAETTLQLFEIDPATGATIGTPINFTYQNFAPNQGQFFFRQLTPPVIQAFVSGVAINTDSAYHFTFRDAPNQAPPEAAPWSTLNIPEELLTTAPPPPAAELVELPSNLDGPGGQGYYNLQLLLPEPKIRRNPTGVFDFLGPAFIPNDGQAFADILKDSGDEFVMGVTETEAFPRIVVIKGDTAPGGGADPATIAFDTAGEPGVIVTERSPARVLVNTLALEIPGAGELDYAYKLFNENQSAAGQGQFFTVALRINDPAPFAVNYGVNVFDRFATSGMTLADLPTLFTSKTINRANNGQPEPDVIWFQFNGGYVHDSVPGYNTRAVFEEKDGVLSPGVYTVDLRVAGIGPNGDYLALHVVTEDDYYTPGGNGVFLEGLEYIVRLDDPKFPGAYETSYGDPGNGHDGWRLQVVDAP